MASSSNIPYEFRIFLDITLYPDTNGRLKLIYDTFSNIKSEKKGGIPIFWGNNEYNIGHRDLQWITKMVNTIIKEKYQNRNLQKKLFDECFEQYKLPIKDKPNLD